MPWITWILPEHWRSCDNFWVRLNQREIFGKFQIKQKALVLSMEKCQVPKDFVQERHRWVNTHDVRYSSWTFVLIIVFSCKRLQYSGRMTIKDLPNELLKIKGREPLPQNYPNHVNNMTFKTHADTSFKSKFRTWEVHFIFACCL